MTKITPEIIDDLILETPAEYQKALEDHSVTGNAPVAESEPESETDSEPGLCPVAEQVAALTEKLDCALHHIADMGELVELHQGILERLANIIEMHTGMLTASASRVAKSNQVS